MHRYAIANAKGGTGKTTTAITLATGFASLGHRVLLIDCDVQGNVAHFLGMEPARELFELLVAGRPLSEVATPVPGFPTLSVIRSDADTEYIDTLLKQGGRINKNDALYKPLHSRNGKAYEITIIDTAPAISDVQRAALRAVEWLIVPAIPEYASEAGISQLSGTVKDLRKEGSNIQLLGILPVMLDSRSKEHAQTIVDLEQAFPALVLPPVRRLIALGEAPRAGQPIWKYAPNSEAAKDYARVLAEVKHRVGL